MGPINRHYSLTAPTCIFLSGDGTRDCGQNMINAKDQQVLTDFCTGGVKSAIYGWLVLPAFCRSRGWVAAVIWRAARRRRRQRDRDDGVVDACRARDDDVAAAATPHCPAASRRRRRRRPPTGRAAHTVASSRPLHHHHHKHQRHRQRHSSHSDRLPSRLPHMHRKYG